MQLIYAYVAVKRRCAKGYAAPWWFWHGLKHDCELVNIVGGSGISTVDLMLEICFLRFADKINIFHGKAAVENVNILA